MWTIATQSALVAVIVSTASSLALLLRGRRVLYVQFAAMALSFGAFYVAILLSHLLHAWHFTASLRMVALSGAIIFTAIFVDALVGDSGWTGYRRRRKTVISGIAILLVGLTPLSLMLPVQAAVSALAVFLFAAQVRTMLLRAGDIASKADRTRLQYLAYASVCALIGIALDLASFLGIPAPAIGGLVISAYLYFICQALLLSRLLDLHELLGKAAVFCTLAATMACVYGLLVLSLGSKPGLLFFDIMLASSLVLILFEPLKAALEEWTTRFFFREHVTFARDIRLAIKQLATIVELQPAFNFVLDLVYDKKRATHMSIYLFDVERSGFVLQAHRGQKPIDMIEAKHAPVFFRHLLDIRMPILRQTVEQRVQQKQLQSTTQLLRNRPHVAAAAEDNALLHTFSTILGDLAVPLRMTHSAVGFLSLRDERLSEAYSKDEIAALTDLAEQLAITIQNSRAFSTLKERDRLAALGEMSAGLAHEIKNPLAAIKGAAQVLDPTRLSGEENELTQIIVDEVNRLNTVVSEFLDYARPFRRQYASIDLNETARRTLQLMSHDIPAYVELRTELESEIMPVIGDAEQIRQVLINLVVNARDALCCERIRQPLLRISTRMVERMSIKSVELCVQDNGPGISPALRDKIFIPFFTTKEKGTGLGLPLCQRIVQDHGGHIDVRSIVGRGSSFIVRLPIRNCHESNSAY